MRIEIVSDILHFDRVIASGSMAWAYYFTRDTFHPRESRMGGFARESVFEYTLKNVVATFMGNFRQISFLS